MSCSHYINGKCKDGFPVTTGCKATANSTLEANTIGGVLCLDEEWCGKAYGENGGKPYIIEEKEI